MVEGAVEWHSEQVDACVANFEDGLPQPPEACNGLHRGEIVAADDRKVPLRPQDSPACRQVLRGMSMPNAAAPFSARRVQHTEWEAKDVAVSP
jgi:hypothetical protein